MSDQGFPAQPHNGAGVTAIDGPQPDVDDDSDILPLTEYSPEARW